MKKFGLGAAGALMILFCFSASEANAQYYPPSYYSYRSTPTGGYTYSEDALGNYHYRRWGDHVPQATFTLTAPVPVARPYTYYSPPPAYYTPQPQYYPQTYRDPGDDIICVPRRYVRGQ